MNFSCDHIVSFTLSAVLHLLGMLLVGYYAACHTKERDATLPELDVVAVELTLADTGSDSPGSDSAAAQPAAADLSPLQLPEPVLPPFPERLPEKPDFTDVLPQPAPVPKPPVERTPPPEPAPVPPPSVASEKPVTEPVVRPMPPAAPVPRPVAPGPAVVADNRSPGGGSSGHIDAHPALERPIRPAYPMGARRRGEEGTVILDAVVTADGRSSSVTLVSSSGFPDLDRAAERAVAQARFKPGVRDGRSVESSARLTLIFRLRDL